MGRPGKRATQPARRPRLPRRTARPANSAPTLTGRRPGPPGAVTAPNAVCRPRWKRPQSSDEGKPPARAPYPRHAAGTSDADREERSPPRTRGVPMLLAEALPARAAHTPGERARRRGALPPTGQPGGVRAARGVATRRPTHLPRFGVGGRSVGRGTAAVRGSADLPGCPTPSPALGSVTDGVAACRNIGSRPHRLTAVRGGRHLGLRTDGATRSGTTVARARTDGSRWSGRGSTRTQRADGAIVGDDCGRPRGAPRGRAGRQDRRPVERSVRTSRQALRCPTRCPFGKGATRRLDGADDHGDVIGGTPDDGEPTRRGR